VNTAGEPKVGDSDPPAPANHGNDVETCREHIRGYGEMSEWRVQRPAVAADVSRAIRHLGPALFALLTSVFAPMLKQIC
jgi:hypothetical protein